MNTLVAIATAPAQARARKDHEPDWVELLRQVALVVFLSVPVVGIFLPTLAGRLVWTVAIASLPLFIVMVGYHRWRQICPLAFVAQLPRHLGFNVSRKVPAWLERNYYLVASAAFLFSLWLRLVATNGSGWAIATFFLLISAVAFGFGLLYTGKSWCNYVCPVSFIEKIYTEPRSLLKSANSQCANCTGCKRGCPDINEENAYWKEIFSWQKRVVYYCYPGLVFGFYLYYFLQSGGWDYYFGGSWTHEPAIFRTAFASGHDAATAGFALLPQISRACASFLTLAICALASYGLFWLLEGALLCWKVSSDGPEQRRHQVFSIASFLAFVTFYSFAGAPTLRLVSGLRPLTAVVVLTVATLSLARRFSRSKHAFSNKSRSRTSPAVRTDGRRCLSLRPAVSFAPPLTDAFLCRIRVIWISVSRLQGCISR
jgi:polyferredoxin